MPPPGPAPRRRQTVRTSSLLGSIRQVNNQRVRPFAHQYYSPNYVEEYDWDKFDPAYFSGSGPTQFKSLPLEEQFRRFPKGIVENMANYLDNTAVGKMPPYLGESTNRRRVNSLVDKEVPVGEGAGGGGGRNDQERDGGGEGRERRKAEARDRRERKLRERQKELERQRAEEQRKLQQEEERRKQVEAEEVRVDNELVDDLKQGALALREEITRFRVISASDQDCDGLCAPIGRFIRLFTRRLKAHVTSNREEFNWRVVQAAIDGVISVLEIIYNWDREMNTLEIVAKKGNEEAWGWCMRNLFFNTGIDQD
ncbi:hypothetical protein QBC45DRAFT_388379 [Copromyces sp. CBS 386.78]|nr:hypothetical protein QBC45DRAFT_388379 [Copromyces sp. CBS 386.78]